MPQSYDVAKELMNKEMMWTFKSLALNKEYKAEREEEMRQREAAKAAKAAKEAKAAEQEEKARIATMHEAEKQWTIHIAAKEAKAAEQEEQSRIAVEKEKSQLKARITTIQKRLKRLQEEDSRKKQESTQAANGDTASMRSGKGSQRSRSSAQLSTTGLLAVEGNKGLNRASSIPDVNFHPSSTTRASFRHTIQWTSKELGMDHQCQAGVAADGSTISSTTRQKLRDQQGFRPW